MEEDISDGNNLFPQFADSAPGPCEALENRELLEQAAARLTPLQRQLLYHMLVGDLSAIPARSVSAINTVREAMLHLLNEWNHYA